jgi:hypothetical protein
MAKKTARRRRVLKTLGAGTYVIPRAKEGCRVKVGLLEFVIPRGKEGCRFSVK